MTALYALLLAFAWWLILRRPNHHPHAYITHDVDPDRPDDPDARASRYMAIWDQRTTTAGHRRDQLALRELRTTGEAHRKRWLDHHQARARWARIPPTAWPRIAAGLAHALEGAQPLLARRVTHIQRRRSA